MKNKFNKLKELVDNAPAKSKWKKGVKLYALELLEDLKEGSPDTVQDFNEGTPIKEKHLLNGACDWFHYSEGGCGLIYDSEIAERLCTDSELKKNRQGDRNPNSRENWLQCQARALTQAARLIAANQ
jgi:hypothetical protein